MGDGHRWPFPRDSQTPWDLFQNGFTMDSMGFYSGKTWVRQPLQHFFISIYESTTFNILWNTMFFGFLMIQMGTKNGVSPCITWCFLFLKKRLSWILINIRNNFISMTSNESMGLCLFFFGNKHIHQTIVREMAFTKSLQGYPSHSWTKPEIDHFYTNLRGCTERIWHRHRLTENIW